MENFIWYNPTKMYFGKGQVSSLNKELKNYQNILFVYGGGSIKKNGLYDEVRSILKNNNKNYIELSGVEPNPKITSVREGIKLVKEHNIDLLLPVGGGSTIDCAKAIAIGAKYDGDIMDVLNKKALVEEGLPIASVLTLAATGTEMNPRSVITNWEENLKLGIGDWETDATYPKVSICDPTYTLTVPRNQTVNGIVDIMSHTLEQYFTDQEDSVLGDQFAESILKTIIDIGPKLVDDLENYKLRETMMLCGTLAWNGLLRGLLNKGDWSCHAMEHALSALYDIPHGEGLAIVTPIWMEYVSKKRNDKFKKLATNVFNISPKKYTDDELVSEGINAFKAFISKLGAPTSLAHYGITDRKTDELVEKTLLGRQKIGRYIPLASFDVKEIMERVYKLEKELVYSN
ncbi:iron-containing alcohol dehydrogenase [Haloplasma contractile]|uniref:NADH-dependent butanol dehydrogenase 2 protein n=1 Tax=Haloplasma contractile SSD-17B TaxID=1033810 RepID=U2DVW8_9MOLU|nr:iron-containing alcohol dehydrogenase [Haloplasma contractile]ERJ12487.1 putative NADH-dependent butanol dehydrogenase 2 protein [Haloplasma contractile SSD-17B]